MDKRSIGKRRIHEILGADIDELIAHFETISPDFAHYVIEFAYGDIYNRQGFDDKTREAAAVACLIGQKNNSTALTAHLKGMLNVGWTQQEIVELLLFLIAYMGFPAIVDALNHAKAVFAEQQATTTEGVA